MVTTVQSPNIENVKEMYSKVLDSGVPSSKERYNKIKWAASILSLLEALKQRLGQLLSELEVIHKLETLQKAEALAKASQEAEALRRFLEAEQDKMKQNLEGMKDESFVAEAEQIQEHILVLSRKVVLLSILKAGVEAVADEIMGIRHELSGIDAAVMALSKSPKPKEAKVEELFALGDHTHKVHEKVHKVRVEVEGLRARVEDARIEEEDVEILKQELKLDKENVFRPEEVEVFIHTFEDLMQSISSIDSLMASLDSYRADLDTFDSQISTIKMGISSQLPSNQVSVFNNRFGFFAPVKDAASMPSLLKPSYGGHGGHRKDEDELLKAIRRYSL